MRAALPANVKRPKKKGPCHHCGKLEHFKKYCWQLKAKDEKHKTHKVTEIVEGSDEDAVVVGHALSAGASASWIVDPGATSHMCTSRQLFTDYRRLYEPEKVSLGDGRNLEAVGRGTVSLTMKLSSGMLKRCRLLDALHVPELSYKLISVSKVSEAGKVTRFDESGCKIVNSDNKVIATATRCGSLYFLDCKSSEQAKTKEDLWHKRCGHLGVQSLKRLVTDRMVDGFDYVGSKKISFF